MVIPITLTILNNNLRLVKNKSRDSVKLELNNKMQRNKQGKYSGKHPMSDFIRILIAIC